jgi:predicted ATP-dependent serine protease
MQNTVATQSNTQADTQLLDTWLDYVDFSTFDGGYDEELAELYPHLIPPDILADILEKKARREIGADNTPDTPAQTTAIIPNPPTVRVQSLATAGKMRYQTVRMSPKFKDFLGDVIDPFHVFIWGMRGSGKSTLMLKLLEEFQRLGQSLYISAEEHISRVTERMANNRIYPGTAHIVETARLSDITEAMNKAPYKFVFIDSLNVLDHKPNEIVSHLMNNYPTTCFFFLGHADKEGRTFTGRGATHVAHLVDVEIKVKKGIAETLKNRFGATPKYFRIF